MRRELAVKAFKLLCKQFFDVSFHKEGWCTFIAHESGLAKTIWFLRTEQGEVRNTPGDPLLARQKEIFIKFSIAICRRVWLLGEDEFDGHITVTDEKCRKRDMFLQVRPNIVRILCGLKQPELLLDFDYFKLDARALRELKRIAMEANLPSPRLSGRGPGSSTIRKPKTLKEAVFAGSRPAYVLNNILTIRKEKKRQDRLARARKPSKCSRASKSSE